jgi:hypothetical protein
MTSKVGNVTPIADQAMFGTPEDRVRMTEMMTPFSLIEAIPV